MRYGTASGCSRGIAVGTALALVALCAMNCVFAQTADVTQKKVLLVTGNDYPGHKWPETAPVVAAALRADARLNVTVVEDVEYLTNPEANGFDTIVLHYADWEPKFASTAAGDALKKLVESGKGLVVLHFACGAFLNYPEFRAIAGRSYDKTLPPHDPFGPFTVKITAPENPIVKGMADFETRDELYTCLAGDAPIQVLATAHSKVTGNDHPMAFTHEYGKGHVFHTPLGHDVQAFANPPVSELIRRGTAWTAGLDPVPATK